MERVTNVKLSVEVDRSCCGANSCAKVSIEDKGLPARFRTLLLETYSGLIQVEGEATREDNSRELRCWITSLSQPQHTLLPYPRLPP